MASFFGVCRRTLTLASKNCSLGVLQAKKNLHVTNHLTFPAMHGVRQEPVPDTLCAAAGGAVCTTGA